MNVKTKKSDTGSFLKTKETNANGAAHAVRRNRRGAAAENVNNNAYVTIRRNRWGAGVVMKPKRFYVGSKVLKTLVLIAAAFTIFMLGFLIVYILVKGIPNLSPSLFSLKYTTDNVSMLPSIINTLIMIGVALAIAVPIGVFSAIYLVEYAKKGNKLVKIIRMMAETLTGIPSIVYGLFGMLFFVSFFHMSYSLLAGILTVAIMVLPTVLRTTEEALMAVPHSYREGSFGLGAGKLRTVFCIVLPSAVPGILSGVILATGRIAGETAALIYTAGTVAELPKNLFSSGRTLSVHMYVLSQEGLHTDQAFATAVVLLVMVLVINILSARIANRMKKE